MSEVKKIATRASYGNALVELGKKHDDLVVLDADLAAATQTGIFKKAFPERHIDCGIAECNMMGIAAAAHHTSPLSCRNLGSQSQKGKSCQLHHHGSDIQHGSYQNRPHHIGKNMS